MLLYSALLASQGSRNSEDFDSALRILWANRTTWKFTPPRYAIPDKIYFSEDVKRFAKY